MSQRSSLDTYAAALVPELDQMAPYLLHSRNREGAWIQCRLRSKTLPLMSTLARQCQPPRADVHRAQCSMCDTEAAAMAAHESDTPTLVESVEHFLAGCQSPGSISLRRDLCIRLRQIVARHDQAKNGVTAIAAMISALEPWESTSPAGAVRSKEDQATVDGRCQLVLGRRTDPVTGQKWDDKLLLLIQRETQNYLLLPLALTSGSTRWSANSPLWWSWHLDGAVSADEVDWTETGTPDEAEGTSQLRSGQRCLVSRRKYSRVCDCRHSCWRPGNIVSI
jgi:hypothetical protein